MNDTMFIYQKIMHDRSGNKATTLSGGHYFLIYEHNGVQYPAYSTVTTSVLRGFANNLQVLMAKTDSFAELLLSATHCLIQNLPR